MRSNLNPGYIDSRSYNKTVLLLTNKGDRNPVVNVLVIDLYRCIISVKSR